jgi:RNA polymerase sigma-70 factor, ECF subfamily
MPSWSKLPGEERTLGGVTQSAAVQTGVDLDSETRDRQAVPAGPVGDVLHDAWLVDSARRGDRAAFGRLYDRYARMVHGILLARVRPEDTDDLVQDVFLLALRRLSTLRDAAAFGAWLAMIARNRAADHYRRSREVVELPENLAADHRPEDEAALVLATIQILPDAYRETLVLRLVEGMTGPEIAKRTGRTPGSVRVNLHRGMQLLRGQLREMNTRKGKNP